MTEFTPVASLVGGVLIGLGASLLLLVNGRVAGISGIAGNALTGPASDRRWRLLFLLGLPLGAAFATLGLGSSAVVPPLPLPLLVAGGLLVGYGTQLGSGCTSGHGVCGVSRGSPRSLAATATFMAAGMLTVFVLRHVLGGTLRTTLGGMAGFLFLGLLTAGLIESTTGAAGPGAGGYALVAAALTAISVGTSFRSVAEALRVDPARLVR